ncbi:MAG: glycosyltransferase [Hahellaceae bacterium]|nr:glycosyltransferase [Hahellaceae bacterium]
MEINNKKHQQSKKVLLVIDDLGSGGAQRQIVHLARYLSTQGHEVTLFTYNHEYNFFESELKNINVKLHTIYRDSTGFSFKVLFGLIKLLWQEKFDSIVSYLDTPNIYSELARIVYWRSKLIVSERSSRFHDGGKWPALIKRLLHVFATKVIANSQDHADWLKSHRWLQRKVECIYNGFPIPPESPLPQINNMRQLRLVSIGRIGPEKNAVGLIKGLVEFSKRNGFVPQLDWVGRWDESHKGQEYRGLIEKELENYPEVAENWRWLGESKNIYDLLRDHHVLIHSSIYEGLPNVICEAMSVGRPIIASDVCDNGILVSEGERGLLFDPLDPGSIASALEKLYGLDASDLEYYGRRCREFAETELPIEKMGAKYEMLL